MKPNGDNVTHPHTAEEDSEEDIVVERHEDRDWEDAREGREDESLLGSSTKTVIGADDNNWRFMRHILYEVFFIPQRHETFWADWNRHLQHCYSL